MSNVDRVTKQSLREADAGTASGLTGRREDGKISGFQIRRMDRMLRCSACWESIGRGALRRG
jgi:hypothetical protein